MYFKFIFIRMQISILTMQNNEVITDLFSEFKFHIYK